MASSTAQTPAASPSQNPDRKKLIQHQLILLLHAHKCATRLNSHECQLPYCAVMKQVLLHLRDCRNETGCLYAHCSSSRKIIDHWRNCKKDDCPVCKDLRRERPRDAVFAFPSPIGNSSSSSQYSDDSSSNSSWHTKCGEHVRAYVVSKIERDMQAFMPSNRWGTLRVVAERVERESYETAQSKEGYFLAIAQKVFAVIRQNRAKAVKSKARQRLRGSKKQQQGTVAQVKAEPKKSVTFECVICLEDFRHSRRRKQTLNCKHVFHTTCIKKWLSRSPACPLCRAPPGSTTS